ncbi:MULTISPECIES: BolA family protein [Marinobacterium]|uniref:Transcriptional regulator, BolA protein family n=2 Tax=Marinobacterium TaxID=48075 RepID=A0A1H5THP1_9GAMM|nr:MULTISPECIES: BolA family protein [Marinobacterium]TCK02679.1 BolA protein family transcriptional regulator [Marinobacterium mangrovicola]SEF62274.1 transcriptional regulator, BolA protein family [Marinobacterium lutimaris]
MSVENEIEKRLTDGLELVEYRLENESHMHSGDRTDTHFKLVAVSSAFEGKRLVQRHQLIYGLLSDLMQNPIHALAMHLHTPAEWEAQQGFVPASPNCMGGSKADK